MRSSYLEKLTNKVKKAVKPSLLMASPRLALLLPGLGLLSEQNRNAFLEKQRENFEGEIFIISDFSGHDKNNRFTFIKISPAAKPEDFLKQGFSAALTLDVEKIITFENLSTRNSTWFLPYLGMGNVIESTKRNFKEMLVSEVVNLVSFGNSYNVFSMNRIFTPEAVEVLAGYELSRRSFLTESINLLNSHGIRTTEIIKKNTVKNKSRRLTTSELAAVIMRNTKQNSVFYGGISLLTYIANVVMLYVGLSLGMIYPLAVFFSSELAGLSNFIVNEKINFKNRGFLNSAYKFGKFNAFLMVPVVLEILLLGVLSRYSGGIGTGTFFAISLISIIAVSILSFVLINRFVWAKRTNTKVYI